MGMARGKGKGKVMGWERGAQELEVMDWDWAMVMD
jgi:hypothetical protein